MSKRKTVKIDITIGDVLVYGPQYPMPETGDPQSMICQQCLCDTEKSVVAEIIQFGIIDDQHYLAVRCNRCQSVWTCNYALEHWQYGTID